MKKTLKLLWIDDDPEREKESQNLEKRLNKSDPHFNIEITFINVKKKSLDKIFPKMLNKQEPDMILIDHMLTDALQGSFKTGSTVADIIRERWINAPIVCVTGVDFDKIDAYKKSLYEEVFSFTNMSNYDATLMAITHSFGILREKKVGDINSLLNLLKVPEVEEDRLKSILPNEIKSLLKREDKSLPMTVSRWVRKTFMAKPGFLFDSLWAATLLGITEKCFLENKNIQNIFSDAEYTGIFSDKSNRRWWRSKLKELIFTEFPDDETIYTWKLGQKLPGLSEEDFNKCFVCHNEYPQTVAFTDETANERFPMHLDCTIVHPGFEKALFFEEIRMMSDDDD